jgi:hypothetical protein
MKSDFFDDITNASMIAAYFITKRRLIGRVAHDDDVSANQNISTINRMEEGFLSSTENS